jgi:hypothetical protein
MTYTDDFSVSSFPANKAVFFWSFHMSTSWHSSCIGAPYPAFKFSPYIGDTENSPQPMLFHKCCPALPLLLHSRYLFLWSLASYVFIFTSLMFVTLTVLPLFLIWLASFFASSFLRLLHLENSLFLGAIVCRLSSGVLQVLQDILNNSILGIRAPCTLGWTYMSVLIVLWLFHLVCILYCGCFDLLCNVWVCVCVGL